MPEAGFEPLIARVSRIEFDTRSNNPSHHGWLELYLRFNLDIMNWKTKHLKLEN